MKQSQVIHSHNVGASVCKDGTVILTIIEDAAVEWVERQGFEPGSKLKPTSSPHPIRRFKLSCTAADHLGISLVKASEVSRQQITSEAI